MVRTAFLLSSLVFLVMALVVYLVPRLFNTTVPLMPSLLVGVLAAVTGSLNTLRQDSGLSFIGHFIISTILAVCILGAVAGLFSLTGQLEGFPRWIAIALLAGGTVLFLVFAGLMGRGPYG